MVKFGMFKFREIEEMQTTQGLQAVTNSNKTHISGYELTHATIHNLGKYDLTPTAKLVLVFLTTHYNESKNGNVVFPSMPYISETLGIGLTATKKAIKDLIDNGFILKSKRNKVRGNLNKYGLSSKLKNQETTVSKGQNPTNKQSESEPFKRSESDRFMITNNIKLNKETTTHEPKVVVASFNSSSSKAKSVKLEDVPMLVRNKKGVLNPCAYWASLDEEVKAEYLLKEREAEEKRERLASQKAEEEARKEEERKRAEEERNLPPFYLRDDFTREQGLNFVANMPPVMLGRSKMAKAIMERFNLTTSEVEDKRRERKEGELI